MIYVEIREQLRPMQPARAQTWPSDAVQDVNREGWNQTNYIESTKKRCLAVIRAKGVNIRELHKILVALYLFQIWNYNLLIAGEACL